MSGTSANGSGTPRITGTGAAAAVIAAAAIFAWYRIGSAPAQGDTVNRAPLTPTPDYIHRGAVAFYNATSAPDLVPGPAPSCNDPIVATLNAALNQVTDGQILCNNYVRSGSATYAGGTESYVIFRTSLDKKTAHGYVIYVPATDNKPADIIIQNAP
jgi:hypothetical protein